MKLVCLEPSSALPMADSDRFMHRDALDNLSPPSSPGSLPLSFFDPYRDHMTSPHSLTQYDLFSLDTNNPPKGDDDPLLLSANNLNYSKAQSFDSHPNPPSQAIQRNLISFDSFPIEPPKESNSSLFRKKSGPALDDSPNSVNSSRTQQPSEISDMIIDLPLENHLAQVVDVVDD